MSSIGHASYTPSTAARLPSNSKKIKALRLPKSTLKWFKNNAPAADSSGAGGGAGPYDEWDEYHGADSSYTEHQSQQPQQYYGDQPFYELQHPLRQLARHDRTDSASGSLQFPWSNPAYSKELPALPPPATPLPQDLDYFDPDQLDSAEQIQAQEERDNDQPWRDEDYQSQQEGHRVPNPHGDHYSQSASDAYYGSTVLDRNASDESLPDFTGRPNGGGYSASEVHFGSSQSAPYWASDGPPSLFPNGDKLTRSGSRDDLFQRQGRRTGQTLRKLGGSTTNLVAGLKDTFTGRRRAESNLGHGNFDEEEEHLSAFTKPPPRRRRRSTSISGSVRGIGANLGASISLTSLLKTGGGLNKGRMGSANGHGSVDEGSDGGNLSGTESRGRLGFLRLGAGRGKRPTAAYPPNASRSGALKNKRNERTTKHSSGNASTNDDHSVGSHHSPLTGILLNGSSSSQANGKIGWSSIPPSAGEERTSSSPSFSSFSNNAVTSPQQYASSYQHAPEPALYSPSVAGSTHASGTQGWHAPWAGNGGRRPSNASATPTSPSAPVPYSPLTAVLFNQGPDSGFGSSNARIGGQGMAATTSMRSETGSAPDANNEGALNSASGSSRQVGLGLGGSGDSPLQHALRVGATEMQPSSSRNQPFTSALLAGIPPSASPRQKLPFEQSDEDTDPEVAAAPPPTLHDEAEERRVSHVSSNYSDVLNEGWMGLDSAWTGAGSQATRNAGKQPGPTAAQSANGGIGDAPVRTSPEVLDDDSPGALVGSRAAWGRDSNDSARGDRPVIGRSREDSVSSTTSTGLAYGRDGRPPASNVTERLAALRANNASVSSLGSRPSFQFSAPPTDLPTMSSAETSPPAPPQLLLPSLSLPSLDDAGGDDDWASSFLTALSGAGQRNSALLGDKDAKKGASSSWRSSKMFNQASSMRPQDLARLSVQNGAQGAGRAARRRSGASSSSDAAHSEGHLMASDRNGTQADTISFPRASSDTMHSGSATASDGISVGSTLKLKPRESRGPVQLQPSIKRERELEVARSPMPPSASRLASKYSTTTRSTTEEEQASSASIAPLAIRASASAANFSDQVLSEITSDDDDDEDADVAVVATARLSSSSVNQMVRVSSNPALASRTSLTTDSEKTPPASSPSVDSLLRSLQAKPVKTQEQGASSLDRFGTNKPVQDQSDIDGATSAEQTGKDGTSASIAEGLPSPALSVPVPVRIPSPTNQISNGVDSAIKSRFAVADTTRHAVKNPALAGLSTSPRSVVSPVSIQATAGNSNANTSTHPSRSTSPSWSRPRSRNHSENGTVRTPGTSSVRDRAGTIEMQHQAAAIEASLANLRRSPSLSDGRRTPLDATVDDEAVPAVPPLPPLLTNKSVPIKGPTTDQRRPDGQDSTQSSEAAPQKGDWVGGADAAPSGVRVAASPVPPSSADSVEQLAVSTLPAAIKPATDDSTSLILEPYGKKGSSRSVPGLDMPSALGPPSPTASEDGSSRQMSSVTMNATPMPKIRTQNLSNDGSASYYSSDSQMVSPHALSASDYVRARLSPSSVDSPCSPPRSPDPASLTSTSNATPSSRPRAPSKSSLEAGHFQQAGQSSLSPSLRPSTQGEDVPAASLPSRSLSPVPASQARTGVRSPSPASARPVSPVSGQLLSHVLRYLSSQIRVEDPASEYRNIEMYIRGDHVDVLFAEGVPGKRPGRVKMELIKELALDDNPSASSPNNGVNSRVGGLARELSIWRSAGSSCTSIVRFEDAFFQPDSGIWLVQEVTLCSLGDIISFEREGKASGADRPHLEEPHMARITSDILEALAYLHAHQIAHRDVRTENMLLTASGQAKLGGFRHACELASGTGDGKRTSMRGSPHWMAPEVVKGEPYGVMVDVWSLGVCVFQMLEGAPPRAHFPAARAMKLASKLGLPPLSNPSKFSTEAREFLASCTDMSVDKRPDVDQLRSFAFLEMRCNRSEVATLVAHAAQALALAVEN